MSPYSRIGVAAAIMCALLGIASSTAGATARAAVTSRPVAAKESPGCDAGSPVAPGEVKVTTSSGGTPRFYFRHVPPAHDGTRPRPLVIDLHGYSEGAEIHTRMTQLGPFGDAHGFVTVTPQGTGPVARWDTGLKSADMKFIGDLLDEVEQSLCIDERRVYVTGLSDGAFMASAIACAYADRVAAVAPVAGIQTPKGCKPDRPVPVVAFHGTADPYVGFDGSLGEAAKKLPAPDGSGRTLGDLGVGNTKGPSIPKIAATWAKRNGCEPKPRTERVAADVTVERFRCPARADVELYVIAGGGHAWPGSEFSKAIESVVGPTTFSISADEIMWKFFEQHPLRGH